MGCGPSHGVATPRHQSGNEARRGVVPKRTGEPKSMSEQGDPKRRPIKIPSGLQGTVNRVACDYLGTEHPGVSPLAALDLSVRPVLGLITLDRVDDAAGGTLHTTTRRLESLNRTPGGVRSRDRGARPNSTVVVC